MFIECSKCVFSLRIPLRKHSYLVSLDGHRTSFDPRDTVESRDLIVTEDSVCADCGSPREIETHIWCRGRYVSVPDDKITPCRNCQSTNPFSILELEGDICPKCREGVIRRVPAPKHELEPGWREAFTRSIIVDVVASSRFGKPTVALKETFRFCEEICEGGFEACLNWIADIFRYYPDRATGYSHPSIRDCMGVLLERVPELREILTKNKTEYGINPSLSESERRVITSFVRWHFPVSGLGKTE